MPRQFLLLLIGLLLTGHTLLAASPQLPGKSDPEKADARASASSKVARASAVMVATANSLATEAALSILRGGGNAVDAALAAQLVLNVVEPQSSGLGGGGFLLLFDAKSGAVHAIDGREEAPAALPEDWFLGADGNPLKFFPDRITGGRAVGVPGLPAALELARSRFGRLAWAEIAAPARRLAEGGFLVSARLANSLKRHAKRLEQFPATRSVFFDAEGAPLTEGTMLKQPELARTLNLLAQQGTAPFYQGDVSRDLVSAVREASVAPGLMTRADISGYRAVLRQPVRMEYRGYTLYGMGPPSSGAVTAFQMLGLLEHSNLNSNQPVTSEAGGIHRFAWAAALAYADRDRYLADGDFTDVPLTGLLDPTYLKSRALGVDWEAPLMPVEAGQPPGSAQARWGLDASGEMPGTTHLVVVDEARNVVSLTSSVEQAFGSGMVLPGWGFFLNNQLTDFSARPQDRVGDVIANRVQGGKRARRTALEHPGLTGGKRPRSSMAPTIVLREGKPVLALGSPGGSRIIQYVSEVLLRVLAQGMSLPEAVQAPHHTHLGGRTDLEPALAQGGLTAQLEALGHKVRVRAQGSGIHAVQIDPGTGTLLGVADQRREGTAAGY